MHAHNLALTRARGMAALPLHVEEACGWQGVVRLFERQGIPLTLLDNPDMFLPLQAMQGLFDAAGRAIGDRSFGLRVGQAMSFADYGIWGRYIASAPTLGAAMRRAGQTVWMHQSGAVMGSAPCGRHTLFFYRKPRPRLQSPDFGRHHADHIIWPMITLVREFLGPPWLPDWIEVDYPPGPDDRALADRIGRPVLFSASAVAIAVPAVLMRTPSGKDVALENRVCFHELQAKYVMDSPRSLVQCVEAIVTLRLLDGKTDVHGTARALGLSSRSLQRSLKQAGVVYRELVEHSRLKRAVVLLQDKSQSITSIALALGYEEPGNFTRAFRRWTGVSPNAFRAGGLGLEYSRTTVAAQRGEWLGSRSLF